MKKPVKETIHAKGVDITIYTHNFQDEFLSLTDIARYKNADYPSDVINNWMRNRNTVEYLGIWERIHNPDFNSLEFEGIEIRVMYSLPNPQIFNCVTITHPIINHITWIICIFIACNIRQ